MPNWVRMWGAPSVFGVSLCLAITSLAGRPMTQAAAAEQSIGALMSSGQFVYRDIFSLNPPGAAFLSRLIHLSLGSSVTSLWILDGLSTTLGALLVFFISRRFCTSTLLAITAGISYPILYYGLGHSIPALSNGWATTASLLAVHLITVKSARAFSQRVMMSGFLTGVAFSLDLFSLAFVPLVVVALSHQVKPKVFSQLCRSWIFAAFAPIAGLCVWVALHGAWTPMISQLFGALPAHLSHALPRGTLGLAELFGERLAGDWLIRKLGLTLPGLVAFVIGIVAFFRYRYGNISHLIALWLVLAFVSLIAQVELRPAQWISVLPVWCITGAAGYELMLRRSSLRFWRYLAGALLVAGSINGLIQVHKARIPIPQEQEIETVLEPLALKIDEMTQTSDSVLIWDDAAQFYLLANRSVAGGLIDPTAYGGVRQASEFFWKHFKERPARVVVIYRAGVNDEQRLSPSVSKALDEEMIDHYVLRDKVGGYEIFVRAGGDSL